MWYIVALIILTVIELIIFSSDRKGDITKMIEANKKRKHMEDMYGGSECMKQQ